MDAKLLHTLTHSITYIQHHPILSLGRINLYWVAITVAGAIELSMGVHVLPAKQRSELSFNLDDIVSLITAHLSLSVSTYSIGHT